jgi:DNA polymerase-3 subunit gamma/tau
MSQALYLKYRPAHFDDMVGQEHVIQTLRNAIASGRLGHAYLFSGTRGSGKTTTARLLAKAFNCTEPNPMQRPCNRCANCVAVNEGRFLDLIEIDAASNTGVDDVRELRDKIQFAPNEGRYKVYIIDEVHMMSNAAFNALLKTLEEPPAHAIFILATTEEYKLPATVLSRCQRHTFRRIPLARILERLQAICQREGVQVEPAALQIVAHHATGSLRDALSLLDQLILSPETIVTAERAQQVLGITQHQGIQDLTNALAQQDLTAGLQIINQTVDEGADPRQFARQMTDHLRNLLLVRAGSGQVVETTSEQKAVLEAQAKQISPAQLLHALNTFDEAARERRGSWLPQLPLEMAFVRAIQGHTLPERVTVGGAPAPTPVHTPVVSAPAPISPPLSTVAKPTTEPNPAPKAPPAEQPSSAPVSPSTPAGGREVPVTLQQLTSHWGEIIQRSRRYASNLPALLEWARPLKLEGDRLTLGYKKQFALDKVSSAEMSKHLQQALQDVTGYLLHLHHTIHTQDMGSQLPEIKDDGPVAMGVLLGAKPKEVG